MNIQYLVKWGPNGSARFILDTKIPTVTPVTWQSPHSKLLIPVFPEKGARYQLQ